eukprot:Phypoly_transcript_16298.p1 GENE.Phypoly_transcript_16298~~Phypoly_transcript_16298.p1  ORF type:complete len:258 (+),score=41.78 Phypoly_transcript_16298:73-846(+)
MKLLALVILFFIFSHAEENFVSMGFLVENNSTLIPPLPCVIYLFKHNVNWTLMYRYEFFESTNSMAKLTPHVLYHLAISCSVKIAAIPDRHSFVASDKIYKDLVVVKFTLVDRPLEVPKCPLNSTNSTQRFSSNYNIPTKGNLHQKGITQKGQKDKAPQTGELFQKEHERFEKERQSGEKSQKSGEQKETSAQKGKNGGWEIPRSWEAGVKMYGKYALFVFMIIQVVWALVVREDRIVRRKLTAASQTTPPAHVVNN